MFNRFCFETLLLFCGSCVWYFKYDIGAYLSRMHDVGMNIHHHNYHYSQSQNTFTHLLVNIRSTSTDGGYEWVLKRWLDGDFKFCVRKATRVDISFDFNTFNQPFTHLFWILRRWLRFLLLSTCVLFSGLIALK